MSTSNSLPSQGNQQGPCVPLLPKPKITGREIALEGAEKVSRFQCRLPGCTNAFVTESSAFAENTAGRYSRSSPPFTITPSNC